MNLKWILFVPLAIASSAAAQNPAAGCAWPANLDAVAAAPANHKVILENEHVRVLEVVVPPHTTEPVHAHCWPSTLYIQQSGDLVDRDAGGNVIFDTRKLPVKPEVPFARWTPPEPPHAIENVSDVPLRLLRIEHKDQAIASKTR